MRQFQVQAALAEQSGQTRGLPRPGSGPTSNGGQAAAWKEQGLALAAVRSK